ncbi:MAG: elongation factor 1-beta [Nanobdellota archaeon]
MAKAIVSMKVMPESPEVDMESAQEKIEGKVKEFAGETEIRKNIQPVAFGLKAINITFVMDEEKGATDPLEEDLKSLEEISSVEVTDVRRAVQ